MVDVIYVGAFDSFAQQTFIVRIGMGVSAMAVLICSNIVISMLRNIIPDKVRIP